MRKVSFFTDAGRQQLREGVHPALCKEATDQQNAICQAFVLLASLLLTVLPTGLECSSRVGSRHAWLHGWSMSSFLPFGIQDWLGSLPDAFQEPILSCLVGVGVGLISFKLRGIKLLSYSHKASEWQAWDSDPDGERNHTRDLML